MHGLQQAPWQLTHAAPVRQLRGQGRCARGAAAAACGGAAHRQPACGESAAQHGRPPHLSGRGQAVRHQGRPIPVIPQVVPVPEGRRGGGSADTGCETRARRSGRAREPVPPAWPHSACPLSVWPRFAWATRPRSAFRTCIGTRTSISMQGQSRQATVQRGEGTDSVVAPARGRYSSTGGAGATSWVTWLGRDAFWAQSDSPCGRLDTARAERWMGALRGTAGSMS